jgi:23S rRNA pseudouridine1911/1915/1917 synthase
MSILPEPDTTPNSPADPVGTSLFTLYRDRWILAVEKPRGLPCHPLSAQELKDQPRGSVSALVMESFPETRFQAPPGFPEDLSARLELQGGLLHRLDNGTSGVLLFARSFEAWEGLRPIIQGGQTGAEKIYVARCRDNATDSALPGIIDYPIAHRKNRGSGRMVAITPGTPADRYRGRPRPARTVILASRRVPEDKTTGAGTERYVLLSISRGQRHQIRCHLAAAGFPLSGDPQYDPDLPHGGKAPGSPGDEGYYLHHWVIRFPHPHLNRRVEISSEPDLSEAPGHVIDFFKTRISQQ